MTIPVLKRCYKEDGGSLFTRSHMEKTRGNGYKLHQERGFTSIQDRYCLGFLYSENNHPLEQPPQGCGRVPIAGGFQDAIGQGAR